MNNTLRDKAMLVRLSVSQWTARKYDKRVSANVAAQYQAALSAGRYNKALVADDALKTIQKKINEARTWHYAHTLPWNDDDYRMLPSMEYLHYTEKAREFDADIKALVQTFLVNYPGYVEDAQARLNGMFDPADYPSVEELSHKFRFSVSVLPLPMADDFRVDLQSDEVSRIQADIEHRTAQAQGRANRDLWDRLHTAVSHMAEKLGQSDAIFRDSLVANVQELCELLPRLNVLEDANLDAVRRDIENKLCAHTPNVLRESAIARAETARDASHILDAMAGYMG